MASDITELKKVSSTVLIGSQDNRLLSYLRPSTRPISFPVIPPVMQPGITPLTVRIKSVIRESVSYVLYRASTTAPASSANVNSMVSTASNNPV